MAQDVFKILKDLELKAVGLDASNQMQGGYFTSFRPIGLPITLDDYEDPWSPTGANLDKPTTKADPKDPKGLPPVTSSSSITEKSISISAIANEQKSYLNTFLLIDSKLQMNKDYSVIPGSSKVSDTWFAILTGANGIPSVTGLSPELQRAYDHAHTVLQNLDGSSTVHFKAYQDYEDKYNTKVKTYNKAHADYFTDPLKLQNWPIDGVQYDNDVKEAKQNWEDFGYKNEIEDARSTLAARGSDPAMALINQAKDRFNNSLVEFTSIGEIPYTILLPNTWYDKDNDDGWNEYTSDDFHSESHYSESDTAYGGGGGFSIGFWSVGGGLNSSNAQSNLAINTNNLEISFSYCTVDVIRPWLDTTLLNLKGWFLMGDYKKNCISDGTMGQQVPSTDEPVFLPSVVTSLILIKNLSIKWDNWQADWANSQSSISAETSVGWGPFSVNGHYHHHEERRDFVCDANGGSLTIPGVQLIGYISAINPPSPSVDSDQYVNVSHPQS